MTTQKGVDWITTNFGDAKRAAEAKRRSAKPPYQLIIDYEIELTFSLYRTDRTIFPGTGRVSGSILVELEEKETLTIPAGTEVSFYCLPNDAPDAHASSVATFFLKGEQVTYKNGVDLFHRKPATPKPRSVPAATPLLRLT